MPGSVASGTLCISGVPSRFSLNGGKVTLNIVIFKSTLLRDEITNSELYGQLIVS